MWYHGPYLSELSDPAARSVRGSGSYPIREDQPDGIAGLHPYSYPFGDAVTTFVLILVCLAAAALAGGAWSFCVATARSSFVTAFLALLVFALALTFLPRLVGGG
jgi:hypothetical protein